MRFSHVSRWLYFVLIGLCRRRPPLTGRDAKLLVATAWLLLPVLRFLAGFAVVGD